MDPAITVAIWWLLFGGTHLAFASGRTRAWLVGRLGARGFELFFSVVAAVTLGLLVHAYADLRFEGAAGLALAAVPAARAALYGVAFAGMTLAVWGVLAFPASPMAPPGIVRPPRGLARITRHAFFAGMAMLAAAHMLLATRLTGVVFFAGIFLLVTLGARLQDRKLLLRHGAPYAEYLAATSGIPFGAIVAGRQRLVWRELPLRILVLSVLLVAALRWAHASLFAAGGAWMMGVIVGGVVLLQLATWARRRPPAAASPDHQRLLAFAAATMIAYVGVVHEVVGTRLYPDGPALLGGPLGWHAVGIGGIAVGVLLILGTLGVITVPLAPVALAIAGVGAGFVAWDATRGGLHFFALTLAIAGVVLALSERRRRAAPAMRA